MSEKEKSDIKFSEKFSLKMRKMFIVSKWLTILLVVVLIAAFIGLNVWMNTLDLPEIDVTVNKIYTLSDESKKALETVNQDIKMYLFGIEESEAVVGLVKQYCEVNSHISYEMLSSESNLAKVQEFGLQEGTSIVVMESGDSKKIINASSEFYTYDYTTYAQIDITEQTLTNSILNLSVENKPKLYFVEGHEEYNVTTQLGVLSTYLKNDAFEISNLNLVTAGKVPEDCDVLMILSPATDFLENEANAIIEYINKGGNIFLNQDVIAQGSTLPNLQRILDVYGVSVDNGVVIETDSDYAVANYPYIFVPQISSSNEITSDIASDNYVMLAYSQKLSFKSDEELQNLKVTKEELLGTTENAMFINDFSTNLTNATSNAQTGHFTVSALVTKTISEGSNEEATSEETQEGSETEENSKLESKLVITANGMFLSDKALQELNSPLSYFKGNRDFAMNAISNLVDKNDILTIRKDMAGATYMATQNQNRVVLAIIFVIPIVIIIVGIVIWRYRKKRK